MTAIRMDGRALAAKLRAEVADDVRAFGEPVCLATILVGADPASHVYVGKKHEASQWQKPGEPPAFGLGCWAPWVVRGQ